MAKTRKTKRGWFKKLLVGLVFFLLIIFATLFIVNGSFLPEKYLKPWDKSYHQQFDDPRIQVIAHGLLAPNAHNMQSWKVQLSEENNQEFTLFVETQRLLPETDPLSRQITVSQGTFLELLRIAAAKLGYQARITLFPEGEYDEKGSVESLNNYSVARILLEPGQPQRSPFYDAIFRRVTTRTPYLDEPLSEENIQQLKRLNADTTLTLEIFQNGEDLRKLKELARQGVKVESTLPATMRETNEVLRMNEYQKNEHRYGITLDSQGLSNTEHFFVQSLGTLFPLDEESSGKYWRRSELQRIEHTPAYALIISRGNSRTAQVQAGMLYSRFQLAGTVIGLSMQPTSQVLQEFPEMAELYQEVHQSYAENGQTIQMMVRLGESAYEVEHSPRLDVMEIIE